MNLLRDELIHIGVGCIQALATACILKRPLAVWPILLVSLLLDLDHWLDYLLTMGFTWDAEAIRTGSYFVQSGRVIVILHSWELALMLIVLGLTARTSWRDLAFGLGLGLFGHLLVDQFTYHQPATFYLLAVRLLHMFSDPKTW